MAEFDEQEQLDSNRPEEDAGAVGESASAGGDFVSGGEEPAGPEPHRRPDPTAASATDSLLTPSSRT